MRSAARVHCDELGLEPVRVDEWRNGDVLFPSVRVNPETIVDLFPADRTGQNMITSASSSNRRSRRDAARFPDAQRADGSSVRRASRRASTSTIRTANTVELRFYEES